MGLEIVKGKKYITGLISKSISTQDANVAGEDIRQIFQSLGFIPQKVLLNIPRHLVTARFLKIPSVDDREIAKIIKIESIKHLPYTDEKVIYGYKIIEKLEDGYSKILLVIAQAAIINNFIAILKSAQIAGQIFVSLGSEALFSWYTLTRENEEENVMLINLDSDHIDIDIIEKDNLVFTRGIAYGSKEPKKIGKIIAGQINISISTYQKESSKIINRIILTGGNSGTAACAAALAEEFKIPVDIINQTKNIPISENAKLAEEDISFAELLGLTLKSDDIKINLMPEDAREEARLVNTKNNLITAMLLFALFAAIAFGLFIKKLHDKGVYLSAVNAELKKIEPKIAAAKNMMKGVTVVREAMARKPLAIDIVSEIYEITPHGVSLNMLDFESGKSLAVRGSAPVLSDVFKYVTILENSPFFEGVKVKYANKRTAENREIADFEIDAVLSRLK